MTAPEIPFARPFMGREEEEAALRVIRSRWLTTGPEALAFEREFAAFLANGADAAGTDANGAAVDQAPLQAFAVNSATAGLHLALEACGAGPGDLVLVPSFTFTATAEVARYLGAEPVLVDVKPGTFHIDPEVLERTLERIAAGLPPYPPRSGTGTGFGPRGRAVAVIPVHYGGLARDMAAISAIARRYGIRVIEDAAHAFPAALPGGRFAGDVGDVGVFSFYATKTITTGEGGMAVTRNGELAARISLMRLHGIDRLSWNRYTDTGASWYYEAVEPGYKYNMPDLLAAIGRVQLGRAREFLRMREEIAAIYDAAFAGEKLLRVPPTGPGDARHLYPLRVDPSLDRDVLINKLKESGIGVSVHFIPLHLMPWYRKRYGFAEDDFPESLESFRREISLPIWPGMTPSEVKRCVDGVISLVH